MTDIPLILPTREASPRIKKLQREIVKVVPRFPNDRETLREMEHKGLGDLLIAYLNWRSRFVSARRRTVIVEPSALSDPRWGAVSDPVAAFLTKVQRGEDLTPHLSLMPMTRGYTPTPRAPNVAPEDSWSDKDHLLNTSGYHHFHLGTRTAAGHAARTDQLIFAQASRDKFTVVAIFSHEVFTLGSAERLRLRALHSEIAFRDSPPGSVLLLNPIMSSGHTFQVVNYAMVCARQIAALDSKLDGRAYVNEVFTNASLPVPTHPKFEWCFENLDLGLLEKTSGTMFWVLRGWN
jgi:hypothetical protein